MTLGLRHAPHRAWGGFGKTIFGEPGRVVPSRLMAASPVLRPLEPGREEPDVRVRVLQLQLAISRAPRSPHRGCGR